MGTQNASAGARQRPSCFGNSAVACEWRASALALSMDTAIHRGWFFCPRGQSHLQNKKKWIGFVAPCGKKRILSD